MGLVTIGKTSITFWLSESSIVIGILKHPTRNVYVLRCIGTRVFGCAHRGPTGCIILSIAAVPYISSLLSHVFFIGRVLSGLLIIFNPSSVCTSVPSKNVEHSNRTVVTCLRQMHPADFGFYLCP